MVSPTAPHGLNVMRLRRQIEAQTPEVMALNDTNMGDPQTGLTKVPDLMVIAEEDTDDTAKSATLSPPAAGRSTRAPSKAIPPTGEAVSRQPLRVVNAEKPRTEPEGLVRGFPQ
ncbi:hypothetical protein ACIQNK_19465 [Streptomyces sp. NPDC091273]|uniref:hypothetical protein n=1 Tax=Streptomyces sp. NPDC091273 TaxID=3365982 RepID=UPI0038115989